MREAAVVIDLGAAVAFVAGHARLLDRRRLLLFLGRDDPSGALAALDAYRNADGGYGWSIEPDLRSPESQPTGAMHAFEVLAEVGMAGEQRAVELCDWLHEHTLPDGGLPFVVPLTDATAAAPWWVSGDPATSTLQMTAQVAAQAHRVARHNPAVAGHPWLATATAWCLQAIRNLDAPHAYELLFSVHFLDAASDTVPEALDLMTGLKDRFPADGVVAVDGGSGNEVLNPLQFAPAPDRPARSLFTPEVIAADLERLAGLQQPDGGWVVDFASYSPAAALEWRGYATVEALMVLQPYL